MISWFPGVTLAADTPRSGAPGAVSPDCAPPPQVPVAPRERLPALACDTHLHVFGDPTRYPLSPTRGYTPHLCSLEQYRALMRVLGVERAVLVQPSVYGTDNSALLDALEEAGPAFRGVAVPRPGIDEAGLQRMHDVGVRGFRLNLVNPAVLSVNEAVAISHQVAALGWHLDLQIELGQEGCASLLALAGRVAIPIVIDHLGRAPVHGAPHELISLLEQGRCWIKLSAPYRLPGADSSQDTLQALVRTLVAANPTHVLWGSDWPHTELAKTVQAADWIDRLHALLPDPGLRDQVFVRNPAALYGY